MSTHPAAPSASRASFRRTLCTTLLLASALGSGARASTAYGTINNFDVVNDTGGECHGFEIEIEDIHSSNITYTFDWNHYGTPSISEDNSNPLHPRVRVRYASPRNPDGTWAHYTAVPSGPIAPTDGHQFTNPSVNFGGEHFGVGFTGIPGAISYFWLVDGGAGSLVRGPAVQVSTPSFVFVPAAPGGAAQVQAAIRPAPAPPVKEFGPATWVKEIRTTTHNNNEVKLRNLLSDDPDDPTDLNWRNGEPDEVEVEWQLLQTDFNKADGGANGELKAAPEELPDGDEVVTRRYEFFKYTGPFDDETGEAMGDRVGPDDRHGEGIKEINGVDVDLSTVIVVGDFIGSQMAAFDPDAAVGLIEHLQDGVAGDEYPTRTLVIAGTAPFTATLEGALPQGMQFDAVTGQISGTPLAAGTYNLSIEARAGTDPVVRKNYTLRIAQPGADLPARIMVDTVADPLGAGSTSGDGAYAEGVPTTVLATPSAGFAFAHWLDNGRVVSRSANYTFSGLVNRSLTAVFVPDVARLKFSQPAPGQLLLRWPVAAEGFVLQRSDAWTGAWQPVTTPPTRVGEWLEVLITPMDAPMSLFRLAKP